MLQAAGLVAVVVSQLLLHVTPTAAEDISTYTLGPTSAYTLTTPDDSTPTGQDFRIYNPEQHPDKIGIFMSLKFKGQVKSTLDDCPKDNPSKCHDALVNLVNAQQAQLQARALPYAVVAASRLANAIWNEIAVIVGTIAYLFETEPDDAGVLLVPADWAKEQSTISPISTLVIATASDDKQAVTAVYTPPPTTTGPGPTITTSSSGSNAGDVVFTLPSDLARLTEDLIGMYTCSAASKAKRDGMTCVVDGAQNLIANAAPGGPLHDLEALQATGPIIPSWALSELQAAYDLLINWAGTLAVLALEPPLLQGIVAIALWLSYKHNILGWIGNAANTIPSRFIGESDTSSEEGSCPIMGPDDTKPVCDGCDGDANNQCTTGIQKGCACNWASYPTVQPGQLSDWQYLDSLMEQWVNGSWYPRPVCPGDQKSPLTIDTALWQSIKYPACKDASANLGGNFSVHMANSASPAADLYSGHRLWTYDFAWTWNYGQCHQTCAEIFEEFMNDKGCAPDPKHMMPSGTLDLGCGTASYKINPKAPPPPPPPPPQPTLVPAGSMGCYPIDGASWRIHWDKVGAAISMTDFCDGNAEHYLSDGDTNWWNSSSNGQTQFSSNGGMPWNWLKYTASRIAGCQVNTRQQVGGDYCYKVLNSLISGAYNCPPDPRGPTNFKALQQAYADKGECIRYSFEVWEEPWL